MGIVAKYVTLEQAYQLLKDHPNAQIVVFTAKVKRLEPNGDGSYLVETTKKTYPALPGKTYCYIMKLDPFLPLLILGVLAAMWMAEQGWFGPWI